MSKRIKVFLIVIGAVCILSLTAGGAVLAADNFERSAAAPRIAGGHGEPFGVIAKVLGLSSNEIRAKLREGKTIVEIAAEQGFSEEEFHQAIKDAAVESIRQKADDGVITQEQADSLIERIEDGRWDLRFSRLPQRRSIGEGVKLARPLEILSQVLGLTAEQIREQMENEKTIVEIAADQGFSEEELGQAVKDAMAERIQGLVADGSITQEQADIWLERMQDGHWGIRFAGPRLRGDVAERFHNGQPSDLLSEVLGLTAEQLKEQLQSGKTIVEIASEQGLSEEALRQAVRDAMVTRIQQKVDDGTLTREQADKILERMWGNSMPGPFFQPRAMPHADGRPQFQHNRY